MIKIPKMSDRFHLKLGELTFILAPLNMEQKRELSSQSKIVDGNIIPDVYMSQWLYLKYGLKGVKGLEDYSGKEYELQKDDSGNLTDDCVSEILMIPQRADLMSAAWQLLNGVPEKLLDHSGNKLKGASLEVKSKDPN